MEKLLLLFGARRVPRSCCLLLALFTPLLVFAYSSNVPAQRTGGFGEQTCVSCHSGTVNPAGGSLTISGPAFYAPYLAFKITVTIQDNAVSRNGWGFQLSARFAGGKQAGSFVGRSGLYLQTVPSTGVQYVSQKPAPVQPGNSYTFTVDWVAPPDQAGGDVIFSASGMASDGSGSGGDHVFTAQAVVKAAVAATINSGGIVNAASYEAADNAAAPGSLISIFGLNLSPVAAGAADLPLPTVLGNTRVLIGGIAAPLLYVSPTQINAQVPFEARAGQMQPVIVQVGGVLASAGSTVKVDSFAPAFFSLDSSGKGPAAAQHANYAPLNAEAPAVPGEIVLLYCAGLGQTLSTPLEDGQPAGAQPTAERPTLTIGGTPAEIRYAGSAPGWVGLYQINAVVPGLPAGDRELLLTIGGKQSQPGVTIAVK